MAEENKTTTDSAPKTSRSGKRTVTVDLVNDTKGRRVIDPGTGAQSINLEVGETKRNVELAEDVVRELRHRTTHHKIAELKVYKAGQAPDPSKSAEQADGDEDPDTED